MTDPNLEVAALGDLVLTARTSRQLSPSPQAVCLRRTRGPDAVPDLFTLELGPAA